MIAGRVTRAVHSEVEVVRIKMVSFPENLALKEEEENHQHLEIGSLTTLTLNYYNYTHNEHKFFISDVAKR